jgi:hypothetical protein
MIILSFNLCGVGGAPKLLTLKRLIEYVSPNIKKIQGTMVESGKAWDFF